MTQPPYKELEKHDTYPHAQDAKQKEMWGCGSKHSRNGDPNQAKRGNRFLLEIEHALQAEFKEI